MGLQARDVQEWKVVNAWGSFKTHPKKQISVSSNAAEVCRGTTKNQPASLGSQLGPGFNQLVALGKEPFCSSFQLLEQWFSTFLM